MGVDGSGRDKYWPTDSVNAPTAAPLSQSAETNRNRPYTNYYITAADAVTDITATIRYHCRYQYTKFVKHFSTVQIS